MRYPAQSFFSRRSVTRLLKLSVCLWLCWHLGLSTEARSTCETPVHSLSPNSSTPRYFLGRAKVDISPQHPVLLSGYAGRAHELTQNVVQPLYARAIVIGEDRSTEQPTNGPAVLIAVDNCAVHAAIRSVVAKELEALHGISPDSLTIISTHTHSAPMLSGALGNLLMRDQTETEALACERYTQQLIGQLIDVVALALQDRRWLTLRRAEGQLDFAINRRGANVVDHQLPILVAYDEQEQPQLVVTNYACHCVAAGSGLEICGDWATSACADLEKSRQDLMAVVLIGCGADQNPRDMGSISAAERQGQQMAKAIKDLLIQPQLPVTGPLQTQYREIDLPLETPPHRDYWITKSQEAGITGYHALRQLRRLDAGEALPTHVKYPIQTWTFGDDLAWTFLGGEVVVDYVHLLRARVDPTRLWVTAYANDVACYIPSHRILAEGGYEGGDAMVWYDLPTKFAPGLEPQILAEVERQLSPAFAASHDPTKTGGTWPRTPTASLATLSTHAELEVQLVAAEPLVVDPVAIDFGPDGRLWVAQMHDYPMGIHDDYKPGGSIRVLRDVDADGTYDEAVTFLDGLPFPTDVKVWRDGALICAAPDVLWARDLNGDGRADEVHKVLNGFETHNYQARVNSLTWGLDHWVYGAAGIFGGQVTDTHGRSIDLLNRDFRFNPDSGAVGAATGRTQQGRTRDDWGNWFGCDNGTLLYHYPVDQHYLDRNPGALPPPPAVAVAASNQLFPPPNIVQWALSGPPGVPTAACGLGVYRDQWLGSDYSQDTFTCEPVNQLVHRMKLQPNGLTFTGHRAENESDREFLRSTDPWFRPVQAKTGPDGGLYIVDMYRYLIEHPRFIDPAILATIDTRAGDRQGRIYRVVPRERPDTIADTRPDLTQLSLADLAAQLDSPNGTWRDLVHQCLWWRTGATPARSPDLDAAELRLTTIAKESLHPAAKIQAMAVLDAWGKWSWPLAQRALNDSHPQVRRHAVRLVSRWLQSSTADLPPTTDEVVHRLTAMIFDTSITVRLQVAATLGEWHDARTGELLARVLDTAPEDPWLMGVVSSSLHAKNLWPFLQARLERYTDDSALSNVDRQWLSQALSNLDATAVDQLLSTWQSDDSDSRLNVWQLETLELMARQSESDSSTERGSLEASALRTRLVERVFRDLAVWDPASGHEPWHLAALTLLGQSKLTADRIGVFRDCLQPQMPKAVQVAALTALSQRDDPRAIELFFDEWEQFTPELHQVAMQLTQQKPHLTKALIAGLSQDTLTSVQLDAAMRQFLRDHPDESIRTQAADWLEQSPDTDWTIRLPEYVDLRAGEGDYEQGRAHFLKHCASCHLVDGQGHAVGPDLRALTQRGTRALLTSILDPNRELDRRYAGYNVLTLDGQVWSGLLQSETTHSLTLLAQAGQRVQLLRNEIDTLRSTGKSLMPEGLERDLNPLQMQDLLAYLGAGEPTASYQYLAGAGPNANYADSEPPQKLVDRQFGTGRFDDGQWVSFFHPGQPSQQVRFDLGEARELQSIRVTYGVNHRPGVIHAPKWMRIWMADSLEGLADSAPSIEVKDWDDSPDGLGIYQIAKRQKTITFPAQLTRYVQLEWRNDFEWTSLAEIEFNPTTPDLTEATEPGDLVPRAADEWQRLQSLVQSVEIGSPTEYEVIPEIWRISLEIGRRDDPSSWRRLLDFALPSDQAPLVDWQAVVIGGGLINGLSQTGKIPGIQISTIIENDPDLGMRWHRSLALASEMAEHEPTPQGTRYDALRMVALRPWPVAGPLLAKYLGPDSPHELQQGAVSGLLDIPHPQAAIALLAAWPALPADLQALAIEGLERAGQGSGFQQALQAELIELDQLPPTLRSPRGPKNEPTHSGEEIPVGPLADFLDPSQDVWEIPQASWNTAVILKALAADLHWIPASLARWQTNAKTDPTMNAPAAVREPSLPGVPDALPDTPALESYDTTVATELTNDFDAFNIVLWQQSFPGVFTELAGNETTLDRVRVDRRALRGLLDEKKLLFRTQLAEWADLPLASLDWVEETWPSTTPTTPNRIVIILHGIHSTESAGRSMAIALHQQHALPYCLFQYPNDASLEESAIRLKAALPALRAAYPTSRVSLVAYSMGGLVARTLLESNDIYDADACQAIDQLIMVCPPNHGSALWHEAPLLEVVEVWQRTRRNPLDRPFRNIARSLVDGLNEASATLNPDSEWLQTLNRQPRRSHVRYAILAGDRGPLRRFTRVALKLGLDALADDSENGPLLQRLAEVAGLPELQAGRGDGVVRLESTRLPDVDDWVLLPIHHLTWGQTDTEEITPLLDAITCRLQTAPRDSPGVASETPATIQEPPPQAAER